jgi:hypothetical protein
MIFHISRHLGPGNAGGGGKNTEGDKKEEGNTDPPVAGDDTDKNSGNVTLSQDEFQARLNEVAGRVRDEERRKFEKKQQDEAAAAQRKKAEEQGEFQRLYESEKSEREKLSQRVEQLTQYEATINSSIDAEIKDWPASVKKMDPGTDNVLIRMKWREDARDLARDLTNAGKAPNTQHGAGSRGATDTTEREKAVEFSRQQYRRPDERRTAR